MKRIIYPVHIYPTKPLNPTHIMQILYADLLYKMYIQSGVEAEYGYNRLTMDIGTPVISLNEYIKQSKNKNHTSDEKWIGQMYVKMHSNHFSINKNQEYKLAQKKSHSLDGHYYYQYLLPYWIKQHQYLFIKDPSFMNPTAFLISIKEMIKKLSQSGLILDASKMGGKIYLDFSNKGCPLKAIYDPQSRIGNYLLHILRDIYGKYKGKKKHIIFVIDNEQMTDFLLIKYALETLLGHKISIVSLFRIQLGNKVQSSRHGGWEPYTLSTILSRYSNFSRQELALGLRLYFLSYHRSANIKHFSYSALDRLMHKSKRLYKTISDSKISTNKKVLFNNVGEDSVLSPYRIIDQIFSNKIKSSDKLWLLNHLFHNKNKT